MKPWYSRRCFASFGSTAPTIVAGRAAPGILPRAVERPSQIPMQASCVCLIEAVLMNVWIECRLDCQVVYAPFTCGWLGPIRPAPEQISWCQTSVRQEARRSIRNNHISRRKFLFCFRNICQHEEMRESPIWKAMEGSAREFSMSSPPLMDFIASRSGICMIPLHLFQTILWGVEGLQLFEEGDWLAFVILPTDGMHI